MVLYLKSVSKVLTLPSFFYVTLQVLLQFWCCFRQSLITEKEIINWESFFLKSEDKRGKNEDENPPFFFWWFFPQKKYTTLFPYLQGRRKCIYLTWKKQYFGALIHFLSVFLNSCLLRNTVVIGGNDTEWFINGLNSCVDAKHWQQCIQLQ